MGLSNHEYSQYKKLFRLNRTVAEILGKHHDPNINFG